jgi:small GTP-binding protein
MLGEAGVGKTAMVNRFVNNSYGITKSTVGATYLTKQMTVKPSEVSMTAEKVKLKIWDTAGDERFRSLTSMYYNDAQAVILVYDTCD